MYKKGLVQVVLRKFVFKNGENEIWGKKFTNTQTPGKRLARHLQEARRVRDRRGRAPLRELVLGNSDLRLELARARAGAYIKKIKIINFKILKKI